MFQEKIDQAMISQTTVWLEDMILVLNGHMVKHRDNLFTTLEKLQEAGYKARQNPKIFSKRQPG